MVGAAAMTASPGSAAQSPAQPAPPAGPRIWGGLRPGRFAARFETRWLRDPSRPAQDSAEQGRWIQIALWRPAEPGSGREMRLTDYAETLALAPPGVPTTWPTSARAQMAVSLAPGMPADAQDRLAEVPVYARADARPEPGNQRLILFAQGLFYDSPWHQSLLAEYLASHGYSVAAPALTGARTMLVRLTVEDLEAQVRDLEYVRTALSDQLSGDGSAGLFGWDLGGMAALRLAARASSVRGVVAFDSGIASADLVGRFLAVDLSALEAPLLIATRPAAELAAQGLGEDLSLLRRLDWVERRLVRVPGMRHAHFAIHAMIENVIPAFWGPTRGTPASQYPHLARLVRFFFDAKYGGTAEAARPLESVMQNVENEVWAASDRPPTFLALVNAALQTGSPQLAELASVMSTDDHRIEESGLERLAAELLYRRGQPQAAAMILRFGIEAFPQSTRLRAIAADVRR